MTGRKVKGFLPNTPDQIAAMKTILNWSKEDVAQIEERMFVEHVLPRLANRTEKQDLSWWTKITGSPARPMDVVRDGKVIFRAPPLMVPIGTPKSSDPKNSAYQIITKAGQKEAVMAGLGSRYLESSFQGKVPVLTDKGLEYRLAWNAIFVKYGFPEIGQTEVDPNTPPPKPVAEAAPSEGFLDDGFDDL